MSFSLAVEALHAFIQDESEHNNKEIDNDFYIEAAVKRERTMAYAFSHQWRACSSQGLGNYELGKASWSWSLKDRWVAALPTFNYVCSKLFLRSKHLPTIEDDRYILKTFTYS
ncbi:hypothetical protein HKD37_11G031530 [Glycine soja]